jgi:hypothetical protein
MAVVVGSVQQAFGFAPVVGPGPSLASSTIRLMHCFVTVTWPTGTYASGDDATFAPATVIQNERRNGKTVTIRQACFVGAGDENGANITAAACTNSSGTVTVQLNRDDITTEHADGAMSAVWNRPLTFCVSFTEAV